MLYLRLYSYEDYLGGYRTKFWKVLGLLLRSKHTYVYNNTVEDY